MWFSFWFQLLSLVGLLISWSRSFALVVTLTFSFDHLRVPQRHMIKPHMHYTSEAAKIASSSWDGLRASWAILGASWEGILACKAGLATS